jgi:amino acid adenylation domain-containing protein
LSARQLITELRSLGFTIAASGGRLRVTAVRGELTDQIRQMIAQQKSALLALLTDEAGAASAEPVRIQRGGALPLSSFQERLWILHRLDPGSATANIVAVWPYVSSAGPAALEAVIRAVLQENEILRTAFRDDGNAPSAHPLPPSAVRVVSRDLRDLSSSDQEATIRADVASATQSPFDLANEAPTRWTLYRVANDRFVILASAHHIVMDEWSLTLLRRRIEAQGDGRASQSTELQYADYAAWQRRVRSPSAVEKDLVWWENQLAGSPQICTFPRDRTTRPEGTETAATRPFRWDTEQVAALRRLIRQEGVTIYMALLATCAAVMRVHTGQDDIVLGSSTGMRERPEFESILGPFVNLLVLRLKLDDDPSFVTLLARARDVLLDALDHRQVPFEMLVDRLRPPRSFDHPPLFQVAVVLHNASDEKAPSIFGGGGAALDLTCFAKEIDGRIEGSLEYRANLYDSTTIDRIARHLQAFMAEAVRDPTQRLSRISLLTEAERTQVVTSFCATHRDLDTACFPVQFERQAAAQPDRPALAFDGHTLSYAALNRRANRIARLLLSCGAGLGALVGVCLDRSPEMVATLLGVQKTGAAYLPMDPQFPTERLRFLTADSGITILVASAETATRLDLPNGIAVIDLAAQAAAIDAADDGDLPAHAMPADIAYLIYTSGSTGTPNGVRVSHGALANFLGAMRHEPGLSSDDVIAAVTTVSFDIAALELYLPLTVGARIELVSRETAADGMALARRLAESKVSVLQATPATWRLLVAADWQPGPGFRALCGGETLPRDLADTLLGSVDALWNLYGPTETTIWSTVGRVERGGSSISIGRPIANTAVYVVDASGLPTAVGIPGEIWIGGQGVALGYHRRPDLTATRFIDDPFGGEHGSRVYRTGDLGRWDAQGRLFHMGRLDRQVKLRGFRIELGEVEAALLAHPAVMRAVVVPHSLDGDHPRLVAYVVYHPAQDLTASEARRFLRRSLPDYMVPSVFVALDAIPLTPNGKVDVRALPDPLKYGGYASGVFEPPAPGLEQAIAAIWQEMLQVSRVGAEDNFFEIGGNSLLALRVIAAIEARCGVRLQARLLFFQKLRQIAAGARLAETEQAGER